MRYQEWTHPAEHLGAQAALAEAGIPALAALALCARGVETAEDARAFLADDCSLLADPTQMADMDRATARITAALAQHERIAIFGDYDVDGITATCLLTHYLRSRGGDVLPYIPDRIEEGYGLNCAAVTALQAQGVGLIVTVDCGITGVAEAAHAARLGVALVVTDHHECKDAIPVCDAVVDPRRRDCPYPFKELAGVGVALKLVLALGGPAAQDALLHRYADLAAIGTVADVMALTGENRTLVRLGLEAISVDPRPGLQALLSEAGLAEKPLTAMAIGFTIAPRLNAAGRMGRAAVAVELFLTQNPARGAVLAQELCSLNRARQEIEAEIYATCRTQADAMPPEARAALVLAQEDWHQGVIGIVASRLTERYCCPAFMISLRDGVGKGSCRSFGGFNLFAALEACADLLMGFGGHAAAAGFSIAAEQIPAFTARMNDCVRLCTGAGALVSTLALDGEIFDAGLLSLKEVGALSLLEPCGAGNPRPVFSLPGATVVSFSEVGGGKHLRLKLSAGGVAFDGIFFSVTAADAHLGVGDRVDAAFTPLVNEYRGWRTVQLQLCDLRPARTRAQSELALYEKFAHGGAISPVEAASLLPTRAEFADLWRYLKSHAAQGRMEETAQRLSRNLARVSGRREAYLRTMVCLAVFHERGLIRLARSTDHLQIDLMPTVGKVDLEQSCIMQQLRGSLS